MMWRAVKCRRAAISDRERRRLVGCRGWGFWILGREDVSDIVVSLGLEVGGAVELVGGFEFWEYECGE